ncbi:hypothetical protein [Brevibacillus sp. FSL K6-2834]|uniref:hypothetical protein n=1 Tax=Brevibacillus sp. FSL K6-2834 TaxID=2954680 RepID=UPI003158E9CB
MNEIKSFLFQAVEQPHPNTTYIWNWEIKLAKDKEGNYLGSAQEALRPHSHTHGWVDTKTDDLQAALEHMKSVCERMTR